MALSFPRPNQLSRNEDARAASSCHMDATDGACRAGVSGGVAAARQARDDLHIPSADALPARGKVSQHTTRIRNVVVERCTETRAVTDPPASLQKSGQDRASVRLRPLEVRERSRATEIRSRTTSAHDTLPRRATVNWRDAGTLKIGIGDLQNSTAAPSPHPDGRCAEPGEATRAPPGLPRAKDVMWSQWRRHQI